MQRTHNRRTEGRRFTFESPLQQDMRGRRVRFSDAPQRTGKPDEKKKECEIRQPIALRTSQEENCCTQIGYFSLAYLTYENREKF
jgi:hypothetical protein